MEKSSMENKSILLKSEILNSILYEPSYWARENRGGLYKVPIDK